jgi:hypothetical protein
MSADTRQQGWLARLATLFATAITLIQKGVRSDRMAETLLNALQLFKENRLAGVVSIEPGRTGMLPDNFQQLLSLKISDLPLSTKGAKQFLIRHGIHYLGEVYAVHPGPKQAKKSIAELEEYLLSVGLPLNLDPISAGWIPPYWNDPTVREALDRPVFTQSGRNFERLAHDCHESGSHYLGQVIADWPVAYLRRRGFRSLARREEFLEGDAARAGLHGAMFVPTDWTPPKGVPAGWRDDRKVIVAKSLLSDGTIERFELSVRTYYCLKNAGIIRVSDLVRRSEDEMLRVKNFGRKCLNELKEVLTDHGLRLGMSDEEIDSLRTQ